VTDKGSLEFQILKSNSRKLKVCVACGMKQRQIPVAGVEMLATERQILNVLSVKNATLASKLNAG